MPNPTPPPATTGPGATANPPVPISFPEGARAASIMQIPNTAWRDTLVPASLNGANFHCEQYSVESGRRLVQHEFPKRDLPFCEDLGHRALTWDVRGYIIAFPYNIQGSDLYQRDYRTARDALIIQLEAGGPYWLQVQTLPPYRVLCERFRLTETEKLGGYCTFDMSFREAGDVTGSTAGLGNPNTVLANTSSALRSQVLNRLTNDHLQSIGVS